MKIALAQINPTIADIESNTRKIISFANRAKDAGALIVVFPELAVTGYPPMDLLKNGKLISDNIRALKTIAEECRGIAVVCGYVDCDPDNNPMLLNSAAFINDGDIAFTQSKTLLPQYDVFDEKRYFTPAREHNTFDFAGMKIGITICEDIWNSVEVEGDKLMEKVSYPEDPVRILAAEGIDLMINLSASPFVRGKNRTRLRMLSRLASEFSFGLVYVNQTGGNDSLIFDGNSVYVNEKGVITSHAGAFTESLTIADTDCSKQAELIFNDLEDIRLALVTGVRDYAAKCGFKQALIGLSGGIDSALTAAIAAEALGSQNVLGITMPSMYSSRGSVDDSYRLAQNLGIEIQTIPIKPIYDEFNTSLAELFTGMEPDITEENLQARIRGTLLMAVSNKTGRLLLTTGNKSELAMGYCTLYGDMNGGLAVISDLPKTVVYELSRYLNREREIIPPATIDKPPSAELRPDQKDQDSLPPYDVLDAILELYIEEYKSSREIIAAGFDEETVNRVLRTVNINEYKRRQAAPGLKITGKAFGTGRRIPMAQRFLP